MLFRRLTSIFGDPVFTWGKLRQIRDKRPVFDFLILVPLVSAAILFLLGENFFKNFVRFSAQHAGLHIDDLFVAGIPILLALTWYSYRRWLDVRNELRRSAEANTDWIALREKLVQVQKMTAIGELAGGIAHDFNNLLMVIEGFGRRAASNLDDAAVLQESLEQICKASDRGTALTRQLLVFSRRQVIEKIAVTVAELIDGVRGLLKHSLPATHEIRFDIENPNSKIETDPNEFVQAILNLVINARDSMPHGGRIVISSRAVVAEQDQTRWVLFTVKDTGQGMDEATLKRIFEPFFTTKERGKGTGLGLAMVYGFVQSSGGRIEVSSTLGEGTAFLLFFPRSGAPIVRAKEKDAVDQCGMGETILLVEDDAPVLKLVKGQLNQLGYKVLTADTAFWALEIDEDYGPTIDVLLTDIIMPGMSGIELAKAMAETRPLMKTIFMSGYTDDAKKTGKLPDGAVFLQKPVKLNHLAAVLRTVIEKDEQAAQVG